METQETLEKDSKIIKDILLTDLALERTILAKQRTTLSEISIFLSTIGLGLLMFKFFDLLVIKLIGAITSLIAIVFIIRLYDSYKRFKHKVKQIDKRNHYFR